MPARTLDQVKKIEAAAAQAVAAGKDGDAAVVRGLKKKLRRAQRKRRRLAVEAARTAKAAAAKDAPQGEEAAAE